MNYLGHLSQSDPLFGYLSADILPQLGIKGARSDFRVFKIWASNQVYLYEDRFSQARIIAKLFEASPTFSPIRGSTSTGGRSGIDTGRS